MSIFRNHSARKPR